MEKLIDNPAQWLIVSSVDFTDEPLKAYDTVEVAVDEPKGHVCPRCWKFTESENEDGLCNRCHEVIAHDHCHN